MSATNRSGRSGTDHKRHDDDAYVTEPRITDALLRAVEELLAPPESFEDGDYKGVLEGRPVLEVHPWANYSVVDAGAGTGSILRTIRSRGLMKSVGIEYRSDLSTECLNLGAPCLHANFFDVVQASLAEEPGAPDRPNLVIMNPPYAMKDPPYTKAIEFVEAALKWVRTTKSKSTGEKRYATVAALLRLPWMASREREAFHKAHPSMVLVIPDRPSFTGDNKVDATDYGWFIWSKDPRIPMGTWKVIDVAHKEKRKRSKGFSPKEDAEVVVKTEGEQLLDAMFEAAANTEDSGELGGATFDHSSE